MFLHISIFFATVPITVPIQSGSETLILPNYSLTSTSGVIEFTGDLLEEFIVF